MTTRRRTRWLPAAALIALAGAPVAVSAAPAAAAGPAIRIVRVSSETVRPGESVRVRFQVTNTDRRGVQSAFVQISGGLTCTVGCRTTRDIAAGRTETFEGTVVAPELGDGSITGLNLAVAVHMNGVNAFDHQQIIVRDDGGAESPAAVSRVSGRVRDAGGKAIRGAGVTVRDSAGNVYRTTSDDRGRFSVEADTIAAGRITVAAVKDGYRTARATVRGTGGKAASVRLTLAAVAVPSRTSASPSATASRPAAEDEPAASETTAATTPPATVATAGDGGGGSLLFMVLGGLLVAAGAGALALIAIRRRTAPAPAGVGMVDAPTAVLPAVPPRHGGPPRL